MVEVFKVKIKAKYALVQHKHLFLSFVQFFEQKILSGTLLVVTLTQYLQNREKTSTLNLKKLQTEKRSMSRFTLQVLIH